MSNTTLRSKISNVRTIEQRCQGNQHGVIRRIFSPNDLGHRLKPFVFFDYMHMKAGSVNSGKRFGFGFHPHSGIATLTYPQGADFEYEDTSGQKGVVRSGGLEWMQAGGGVWHEGFSQPQNDCTGFQLWLALPPVVEDSPSEGLYVPPEAVPAVGNVKVLLGEYQQVTGAIGTPSPVHYFDLTLTQGEQWSYQPPANHTVAWCFVYQGSVAASGETLADELAIFDETDGLIGLNAITDARVMIGTAVKHDYPLVLGYSSVHTNHASLKQGLARIEAIGADLRSQGRI